MSPTQRALKQLRAMGYQAEIVEKNIHIPGGRMFKRDLFECIDIIGVRAGAPILGIQATGGTGGNRAARVAKCIEKGQGWLAAGGQLEVWAWRKIKGFKALQLDRRIIVLTDNIGDAD